MSKKHKEIFGLDKLPESGYIKALQEKVSELMVQKGQDTAYIQELEFKLKQYEGKPTEDVKRENAYKSLKGQVAKFKKENLRLMKSNKELVHKLLNAQKQNGR